MDKDFNLIWQAMKNQAFPDAATEDIAKRRLAVCVTCPKMVPDAPFKLMDWFLNIFRRLTGQPVIIAAHTGYKCGACGCNLNTKSRHPRANCPKKKWTV